MGEMTGVQEARLAGKTDQHSGLRTNQTQEYRNPAASQNTGTRVPFGPVCPTTP